MYSEASVPKGVEFKVREEILRLLFTTGTKEIFVISVDFFSSRIQDPNFFHPGSRIYIKEVRVSILNQKILFFKLSEILSGLFIPDPEPDFLPIPDPQHCLYL
jgi:hypothetical protein